MTSTPKIWFVSYRRASRPVRSRHALTTDRFESEAEAKSLARTLPAQGSGPNAATINPHMLKFLRLGQDQGSGWPNRLRCNPRRLLGGFDLRLQTWDLGLDAPPVRGNAQAPDPVDMDQTDAMAARKLLSKGCLAWWKIDGDRNSAGESID
jgi:hypothetical protein